LQRIGLVLHISSSGNLILKAENLPRIGDQVVDENLSRVGTVFDIFGSASTPYIAVRPTVEAINPFLQRMLYAVPSSNPRKERKR
jgi:rRNA processing protein Gar1